MADWAIATSQDLSPGKDRTLYRALEMLPGFLTIFTLLLIPFLSLFFPQLAALFIICFSIYWLFKSYYWLVHLWATFRKMREIEKENWLSKLEKEFKDEWRKIKHIVVIPNFKEPVEVLRETLNSVYFNDFPKENIVVVLAFEEREGETALRKKEILENEFKNKFMGFFSTFHPQNLPGEIPGKASNETFALKSLEGEFKNLNLKEEETIITSLDADTILYPQFFSRLTFCFLKEGRDRLKRSYQPVPLFLNNILKAPFFSRIFAFTTTFWAMINQHRPEKLITFSSHSIPWWTLKKVGYKQVNVVSDDSRIFWQCFFEFKGDYFVVPLFYPISMQANVAENVVKTYKNLYKQERRWAYGVSDIPYFLFRFLKERRNIPFGRFFFQALELIEGHWSWATASLILFFLGWLPVFLGGGEFEFSILSYNLPNLISRILSLTWIGLASTAILSLKLIPKKYVKNSISFYFLAIQWITLPVLFNLFSLPPIEAQIRLFLGRYLGFWPTPKSYNTLPILDEIKITSYSK